MASSEAMTSSTRSFAYSYRLVKKCFVKICKTSKCHNFLIFQPIFIRFSLFCSQNFTLSSEIKLNLFRSSPLSYLLHTAPGPYSWKGWSLGYWPFPGSIWPKYNAVTFAVLHRLLLLDHHDMASTTPLLNWWVGHRTMREPFKSITMGRGAPFATTNGMMSTPKWCVANSGFQTATLQLCQVHTLAKDQVPSCSIT